METGTELFTSSQVVTALSMAGLLGLSLVLPLTADAWARASDRLAGPWLSLVWKGQLQLGAVALMIAATPVPGPIGLLVGIALCARALRLLRRQLPAVLSAETDG